MYPVSLALWLLARRPVHFLYNLFSGSKSVLDPLPTDEQFWSIYFRELGTSSDTTKGGGIQLNYAPQL